MKNYKILIRFIFIFCLIQSCQQDCQDAANPECENYDPCFGRRRINSLFRVRPGDNGFKAPEAWCDLVPCDTFNASSVRFNIPMNNPENCSYFWQIGSEPTHRSSRSFEIDFSDYLSAGNWESHIPISLMIKTPLNQCMTRPEDTFIKVTRNLFFTNKPMRLYKLNENTCSFNGVFLNQLECSSTLTFIEKEIGQFRGVDAPFTLIVGLPFTDTLIVPTLQQIEGCYNYRHSKFKILNPEQSYSSLTHYLSYTENFYYHEDKILKVFEFSKPSGWERYEFVGKRTE